MLPVPGMMVIETKRHVSKIEDLKDEELADLFSVWTSVSKAVRALGFDDITHVIEDRSSHLHLWLMPIHPWMRETTSGKLRNIQDIFDYVKENMITEEWILKTEEAVEKISSSNYVDF